jgi:O-acetyl-ADP-ribose deacetylase (regulator of RNase III)
MDIVLTAVEAGLARAWEQFCGDLGCVHIYRGSILDVECDAVVSPANSFGFMDGGVDAVYLDYFGAEIQMRVRRCIYEHHAGELVVGTADIVATEDARLPYLIVAPTRRVPMVLQESVNAYLAARAALFLVLKGSFADGADSGQPIAERVGTIAFPDLDTGVGRLGANTCARQVRAAIEDTVLGRYTMPRSWAETSERHQLLYTNHVRRLKY